MGHSLLGCIDRCFPSRSLHVPCFTRPQQRIDDNRQETRHSQKFNYVCSVNAITLFLSKDIVVLVFVQILVSFSVAQGKLNVSFRTLSKVVIGPGKLIVVNYFPTF